MSKNKGNFFVIVGSDFNIFEEFIENLKKKQGFNDFDQKVFYAGDVPVEKIIEEVDFLPVFSEKKLIVVKGSEKLTKKDCEKLESIIKKCDENLFFVITGIDIKEPLKKYAGKYSTYKTPENILFSQIYSIRKEDKRRLRNLIREYLTQKERNFQVVVAAAHIYLKNLMTKKNKYDKNLIKKFEQLHELDFSLKIGKIHPGEELEIFFYYFFS